MSQDTGDVIAFFLLLAALAVSKVTASEWMIIMMLYQIHMDIRRIK